MKKIIKKSRNIFSPIIFSFLVIFVAIFLWTSYWFIGSYYIKNRINSYENLSYKNISITGYPFYFKITAKELSLNTLNSETLSELNLKTLAWRFDQIQAQTDSEIRINLTDKIFLKISPEIIVVNYQKNKDHINDLKISGEKISFSDNLNRSSLSIDKILGNIEYSEKIKIALVAYKGRSSLEIIGNLSKDNKDYLKGKIEFSFSDPEDIKRFFQLFGVIIEENPITNLLIYRGKIDLIFEDGITLLGPLPIGKAPKIN